MDIYITGKIENNIMNYAAYSTSTGYIKGTVQATNKIEGQLYGVGAAIIKALEKDKSSYINIHTDLESPVKYANGAYTPVGDVAKRFVKKLGFISKSKGCSFSFDTELSKERAEKLFKLAFSSKEETKIEKPLANRKREVQPNRVYQNWMSSKGKSFVNESEPVVKETEEEQLLWEAYFAFKEIDERKAKEEALKAKEEVKPLEVVPYSSPLQNLLNIRQGKDVSYDKDSFEWRITSYDKDGNLKLYLSDKPYPAQISDGDGIVAPKDDWLKALYQGCYDEQVNKYDVIREGTMEGVSFNDDRYKYFFIFGKDGNTLGTVSYNRKNISIQKKDEKGNYHYFYDGKIVLDASEIEDSAWNKFAGVDFDTVKSSFNEFFDTINSNCKKFITEAYEKSKNSKQEEPIVKKTHEKTLDRAVKEPEPIDEPEKEQLSLFDL